VVLPPPLSPKNPAPKRKTTTTTKTLKQQNYKTTQNNLIYVNKIIKMIEN
jgi:hypothetical protein